MDVDDTTNTTISSNEPQVPVLQRDYTLDCAICLQPFVQPVQLPCSHTFCFLCAKGIALQRQPCALCRADIPLDFLTKPGQFQATGRIKVHSTPEDADPDSHVWYYQGHRGWWQYDERTSAEIEEAFKRKEKNIDILIAGAIYVIDFEAMVQYQRNTNSRKRKIKRDTATAQKKGVAGMHLSAATNTDSEVPETSTESSSPTSATNTKRQPPLGNGN